MTIKDQVYAILKAEICRGVHADGQRLHENELAARLNVSRSPVREALRQLASDGLVLELPNKGVFVRELTPKDITDIFEVRVLLESYAIRRVAGNITPETARDLCALRDEFARLHAANDLDAYMVVDGTLHHALISIGGNNLALSIYDRISSLILKFRGISLLGKERFDESVEEHCGIITHVVEGNAEDAVAVSIQHLDKAKQKIIEYILART